MSVCVAWVASADDELDLDGSDSLDLDEMKVALKRMQTNVTTLIESMGRVKAHATNLRSVAARFDKASADTAAAEGARAQLQRLREAPSEEMVMARVAYTIKKRKLTIATVVTEWATPATDTRGGHAGVSLESFCRGFEALGANVTPAQLTTLFEKLDTDSSGMLEENELEKLLVNSATPASELERQAARKADAAQVKVSNETRQEAEASQRAAQEALEQADAEYAAACNAAKEKAEAKVAAQAKVVADRRKSVVQMQVGRGSLQSFMKRATAQVTAANAFAAAGAERAVREGGQEQAS